MLSKRTVYDELVTKFNAVNPSKLVKKLNATQKIGKLRVKFSVPTCTLLLLTLINYF